MTCVYPTKEDLVHIGFPFIQSVLAVGEPAPDYLSEQNGMAELLKVLSFVQQDAYYPTAEDKAGYILCSISGSQYFSNGNKRLAVTTLMIFLAKNNAPMPTSNEEKFRELLRIAFPLHDWETNEDIAEPHALFLYNLAILIGNRPAWGTTDFTVVRETVSDLLYSVYFNEETTA